ncbi:MAG: hypothetical protein QME16_02970, partial [Planctomycetota bacterium]|nr:hypothetical protein [Planctomycetota bacterium]
PSSKKVTGTMVVIDTVIFPATPKVLINIPLVHFAMVTNQPDIVLKSIRFEQTGTIKDEEIKSIRLYLDNGDEVFDGTKDVLLSSSVLKDNICEFTVDQPIISQPQSFFIVIDIIPVPEDKTVSFLFTEGSFVSTDILGVIGNFPFSTAVLTVKGLDSEEKKPEVVLPEVKKPEPTTPEKIEIPEAVKDIMAELEKEKSIKMQENEFIAQKYYEMALKLFKEFNYNQARDMVTKALEMNPYHKEAGKLLQEIQLILGSRSEEIKVIKEFLQNQLAVKIQETELVVRNHYLQGEKLFGAKKYREAQLEYEAVVNKLKWLPYEVGLKDYLVKAQERLKEIDGLIIRQEEESMRKRREAAARIAQEEEIKRQKEYSEKIRALFKDALIFFEQKRFQETERLTDTILELAPHFTSAKELRKEAIRARHYEVSAKYVKLRSERFKALYDELKETLIPYADDKPVRYDREVWEIASKRSPLGTVKGKAEEDPDIVEIKRKLKTIKHDFKLEGQDSLYDVMDLIQYQYKIAIVYAADVKQEGIPNEKKQISLIGLPLEIGLKNLLELYKLTYVFDREIKCLKITKMGALEEDFEWRVHNVDDLVRPVPEFPGPNIEISLTPGGTKGWEPPPVDLPPVGVMTMEELMELIKKNTGKDRKGQNTWDVEGASIKKIGDSNKMMIVHTPTVQDEVVEFLQILRSFRSAMIYIEATFITTSDDLLEDLGIQWRNIPRVGLEPTPPGIPGQPNPTAGILPGGNRDIRFRSAYSFRDTNNVVETALPPSAIGGLGLQFATLGKPRTNMLLTALERTGKGTIIDSPKITALNGQRVNVSFIRQRQYIQDGDIQSGAIAYEPVINTFSTGVVLDVKPVMSYDRKFITIHIFPTILELIGLREITLQYRADPPGVIIQLQSEITIELPWLRLQRCRTSAVVPDGGALVLGGMKTIYDRDITASTPLVDKIPVIATFFRRKVRSEERRYQIIVIRAKIVELPEIEEELR